MKMTKRDYLKKIQHDERSKGVKKAIGVIQNEGVSTEQLAIDLEVTAPTIWSWKSGRRVPKYATINLIESHYKNILNAAKVRIL